MFDFDPYYHRSPRLKPGSGLKAVDFAPEDFSPRAKQTAAEEDLPGQEGLGPGPTPFYDFAGGFKPQVETSPDLPSLDDLFKPFDLDSEHPVSAEEAYEDLYAPSVDEFYYEDMDTRPPEVIKTLAQAEQLADEIVSAARAQADETLKNAKNEAAALIADLKRRQEQNEQESRQEIERRQQSIGEKTQQAEAALAAAESERLAAEQDRTEAAAQLAEAEERIAGLEGERNRLEQEHAARLADLEQSKEAVLAEAKAAGLEEGRRLGMEEGRKTGQYQALENFQKQVEDFLALADKLEKLYDDLWQANAPMMIKLALEAAGHIVNKELSASDDLAVQAFKACIDYLSRAHKVTVLVRPQDIAGLELAKAEQRERLGALVKVEFKGDDTLGPGDLIIESDIGRLDATIKHRTAEVLGVLRQAFEDRYGQAGQTGSSVKQDAAGHEADIVDVDFEDEAAGEKLSAPDLSPPANENAPENEPE